MDSALTASPFALRIPMFGAPQLRLGILTNRPEEERLLRSSPTPGSLICRIKNQTNLPTPCLSLLLYSYRKGAPRYASPPLRFTQTSAQFPYPPPASPPPFHHHSLPLISSNKTNVRHHRSPTAPRKHPLSHSFLDNNFRHRSRWIETSSSVVCPCLPLGA